MEHVKPITWLSGGVDVWIAVWLAGIMISGCAGGAMAANEPVFEPHGDARATGISAWGKPLWQVDSGRLVAGAHAMDEQGFTVHARVRLLGPGKERGNSGAANGTICSQGIGYWNGWRLTVRYPDGQLGFEIGRPEPLGSVAVWSAEAALTRCWMVLTATWDRHVMRLYLDGVPIGTTDYAGPYTDPGDAPVQMGFAGYGVGSTVMETDGLTLDSRAWTPEEVWQAAWPDDRLRNAVTPVLRNGAPAAETLYQMARKADLPDWMQEWATRRLSAAAMQGALVTGEALQWLTTHPDVAVAEKRLLTQRLARWLANAGRWPEADRLFTQVLSDTELTQSERWMQTLEYADRLLAAGRMQEAEGHFRSLLAVTAPLVRFEALCGLGRTHLQSRRWGAAESAFRQAGAISGLTPHLRWEAEEWTRRAQRLRRGAPEIDPADWRTPAPPAVKPVYTLYVSPAGSDSATGTRDKPLASLEAARDRLRAWRRQNGRRGAVAVCLLPGEYRRAAPLVLGPEDGGTAAAPVIWKADASGIALLNGGVLISGFHPVTDAEVLTRLPESVRGRVLSASLPEQITLPDWPQRGYGLDGAPQPEVFHQGQPLQPARWPNTGWILASEAKQEGEKQLPILRFTEIPAKSWLQADDLCLAGYPFWHWADYRGPARFTDLTSGTVLLSGAPPYGVRPGQPWYFLHILEELDTPGEWYIDRASRRLYLLPPPDWSGDVVVTTLDAPLIQAKNVRHLRLEGLRFANGRDSAVHAQDCADLLIYRCDVRCMGGDGFRITGERCSIRSTQIGWMGRGGIRLAGGDRRTLSPSGNLVENCHIHHLSRLDRTYTPAVWLDGVGATVRRNLFEHIASSGMRVEGNDHLVELNVVRDVVTESDDQGGLDMWGDPTYRGNVIRFNRWERIGGGIHPTGQAGVRLDDAISGTLVYGNLFIDCTRGLFGGVQLHGGKDNIIDNNRFEQCVAGISLSPWGPDGWRRFVLEGMGASRLKLVDVTRPPYSTRYPELARLLEEPDRHHIWRNCLSAGAVIIRDNGIQDAQLNRTDLGDWLPGSWQIVPLGCTGRYPDTGEITSSPRTKGRVTVKGGDNRRPAARKR